MNNKRDIEILGVVISFLGLIGVILTIYFGFKAQTNAINNQWGQEYYKQRMSVYIEASEAASKIANLKHGNSDSLLLNKTILEFQTLYLGPMAVLEGVDVEKAMFNFNKGLEMDLDGKSLKSLALYLSHILRNEAREIFLEEKPDSHYGNNKALLLEMDKILDN